MVAAPRPSYRAVRKKRARRRRARRERKEREKREIDEYKAFVGLILYMSSDEVSKKKLYGFRSLTIVRDQCFKYRSEKYLTHRLPQVVVSNRWDCASNRNNPLKSIKKVVVDIKFYSFQKMERCDENDLEIAWFRYAFDTDVSGSGGRSESPSSSSPSRYRIAFSMDEEDREDKRTVSEEEEAAAEQEQEEEKEVVEAAERRNMSEADTVSVNSIMWEDFRLRFNGQI